VAYIANDKQENNILKGIRELTTLFSVFQLVNTVLRALHHVLVLGCSGQNQNLGPLLASLKVTTIGNESVLVNEDMYGEGDQQGCGWEIDLGMGNLYVSNFFRIDILTWQCQNNYNTALKQTTSDTGVVCSILNKTCTHIFYYMYIIL